VWFSVDYKFATSVHHYTIININLFIVYDGPEPPGGSKCAKKRVENGSKKEGTRGAR